MTRKDKDILFVDLSARLPYGVMVAIKLTNHDEWGDWVGELTCRDLDCFINDKIMYDYIKPYLRPMSSMTKDERKEFSKLLDKRYCEEDWEGHISTSYCIEIDNVYTDDEDGIKYPSAFLMDAIDWLNANYFDYRGLIEKGLAIEVTKENNPYV